MRDKLLFLLYVAIGGFGAIGQAMWLRHDLVDSYPFKMMDMPPFQFYAHIGEVGAIISPAIAITLVFLFMSVKKYWIPAVPVVACPLERLSDQCTGGGGSSTVRIVINPNLLRSQDRRFFVAERRLSLGRRFNAG
jgi:hypothetical protein